MLFLPTFNPSQSLHTQKKKPRHQKEVVVDVGVAGKEGDTSDRRRVFVPAFVFHVGPQSMMRSTLKGMAECRDKKEKERNEMKRK